MTEYHDNDLLVVEVDSTCANLALGKHVVGYGKQRLQILAKELPLFQSMLETNVDDWKRANVKYENALKAITGEDADFRKAIMSRKNGPGKRFRDDNLRDPLPLLSLEVVENKGRQLTKEEVLENESRANKEERGKVFEILERLAAPQTNSEVEVLKSQVAELMKTIEALTKAKK